MVKRRLGIYIHIPFCARKCIYCDFLSFGVDAQNYVNWNGLRKDYINALCIELLSCKHLRDSYIVDTIFIGGGTPSILMPGDIEKIMDTLRLAFSVSKNAEITIEANPGTLTESKVAEYIHAGINRISIGLQSANDEELALLGRIHNYDQFLVSYDNAREAGFENINIDLISAVPGQTLHTYLNSLEKVMKLKPAHISAYSLIVEDGTPLAENDRLLRLIPDEDTDRKMYEATERLLISGGYNRYEISNYARTGYECRHNIKYWTLKEYIGFGIGASSFFNQRRFSNTQDMDEYIRIMTAASKCGSFEEVSACVNNIRHLDEAADTGHLMEEFMFLGLRMTKGVSASSFHKKFNRSIYEVYGQVIDRYVSSGHLVNNKGIISFTKKGLDVSNSILADFLLD